MQISFPSLLLIRLSFTRDSATGTHKIVAFSSSAACRSSGSSSLRTKSETRKFKVSTGDEKSIILVIDDEQAHLEMVKNYLKEDYEVVTVLSCKESLKLLYQGLNPDYILLDLMMPEVDGWDTYERIKSISNLHNVPIAIFTSSDDPKDRKLAQDLGAADYIKKPCKKSELLERIKLKINK